MASFIVVQRKDGRGGCRPFNSYGKNQAGAEVNLGNKYYKVTSDGRMNIPKAVFDSYGITGKDGRKRIEIEFSTSGDVKPHWSKVGAVVRKPLARYKNSKTGISPTKQRVRAKDIMTPGDEDLYLFGT